MRMRVLHKENKVQAVIKQQGLFHKQNRVITYAFIVNIKLTSMHCVHMHV